MQYLPVRSVDCQRHDATTNESSNRDGHDPRKEQEADSLPVDSLEGAVAKTDSDSCASDAHRGRDWESILREDKNGDGGAHLHGRTTAGGVIGEFVAHD